MKTQTNHEPDEAFIWANIYEHSLSWCADKLHISTATAQEYYVSAARKVTERIADEEKLAPGIERESLTYLEAEAFEARGFAGAPWRELARRLNVSVKELNHALARAAIKLFGRHSILRAGCACGQQTCGARDEDAKGDFFHD